jgi:hypothetical protein
MEFADIFAYDLSTLIVAGPAVVLAAFALAAAWLNRAPTRVLRSGAGIRAVRTSA